MPTVRGFKGIRYNPEKIGDFSKVLAPPYDVISQAEQKELLALDPHNVVRLVLPKGDTDLKYERAAKTFRDWFLGDVLIQDEEPSIYPYHQEFEIGGKKYTRKGFIAKVKLEDFSTKKILPHELTFPKHKQDRLKLNTACKANMSPVFSVYSDPEGDTEKAIEEKLGTPIFDVTTADGVRNILWKISDKGVISRVAGRLEDTSFLIADGHHRYETALDYRRIQRESNPTEEEKPYDYVMMFLARGEGEGLIINPTHRLAKNMGRYTAESFLAKLGEYFNVKEMEFGEAVSDIGHEEFTVITGDRKKAYRVSVKDRSGEGYSRLGVMLLHKIVFKDILNEEESGVFYTKFLEEAVKLTGSGEYPLGFILPELKAGDIFDVVRDGERMPHKTTYFYPKILSGLTFNPLW
ncbi:MAG TPA: DUF1015 domain-containing protein [Thermodesulfobacteriota bacterium]|nr:DUF1015 domain-containing protein [Thermodesulfobacteriota bacterium]